MKKLIIAVLTVALLVPTVALAGNGNRFKGDGKGGGGDKKTDVTFRISGNEKHVREFRARKFKFKCNGRKDFKSNWIKFDKNFKIRGNDNKFRGKQTENSNGVSLKGKVNGRLDGKKNDLDEAHGRFNFEVTYPATSTSSSAKCKSGKVNWEADR